MRKYMLLAAILLWGSPAIAGSARNERLYDHVVELRDRDPDKFDGRYPFIGRLVSDDAFFGRINDRWQSHPLRFEHYHDPLLIRILDGKPGSPWSPPDVPANVPPVPPPACQDPPGVVPEPGSLAMLPIGLGMVFLVRRLSR